MKKATIEVGVAILLCALCTAGLIEAWGYRAGAGLMPRAVMIFALGLSVIWVLQSLRATLAPGVELAHFPPEQLRAGLVVLSGTVFLLLGMAYLGFFTSAILAVPAIGWGLGYRNIRGLALGTAFFVILLLLVFKALLALPLPPEALFQLIGG